MRTVGWEMLKEVGKKQTTGKRNYDAKGKFIFRKNMERNVWFLWAG